MKFSKAIITAGPTREWIDPVRFISNASSGKMGHSIAGHLATWIDNVVYIHGNVCSEYRSVPGARSIAIETTSDLKESVLSELNDSALLIMAAAPADFRPASPQNQKIKKEVEANPVLSLEKNPDILLAVAEYIKQKNLQGVSRIGFAAETENIEEHALDKLKRKNLDMIIANKVFKNSEGFGDISTEIFVYSKHGLENQFSGNKNDAGKFISDLLQAKYYA